MSTAKEEDAKDDKMPVDSEDKEPEKPKESEQDEQPSSAAKIPDGCAAFHTDCTTMNVLPVSGGRLLSSLSDGGFQYLLAGARANVGVKSGRYMFETMIVESRTPSEMQPKASRTPLPKQLVRVGFSSAEAGLLMDGESVSFDSEGFYWSLGRKSRSSQRFAMGQMVSVVLNLDPKSPNANSVSLFCNGVRVSEPQRLPEALVGKALYPAVSYKNVLLQVNLGPALTQLPFKCLTVQEAQKTDAVVEAKCPEPKDGKSEVFFPVGLPDEGTFEWLDQFLAKRENKKYVELSDRAILQWAQRSGVQRSKGYENASSNDKPEMSFGIPLLDDFSVQRLMHSVAQALPRHYIVAEVKGNLTIPGRKAGLAKFPDSEYRRIAKVVMGEPPTEFKSVVKQHILDEKRAKAEADAKAKRVEEDRKRKLEDAKKSREEAAQKAKEARESKEKAAAVGDEAKEEKEEAKEESEEAKEEKQEETNGEDERKNGEEEKKEQPAPVDDVEVELTEEEEKLRFRKRPISDLTSKEMSSFAEFCIPSEGEGFEEITFEWQKRSQCEAYLKSWVLEKKMTQRVEDLQPSEWFRGELTAWNKVASEWKRRQHDFSSAPKRSGAAKVPDATQVDSDKADGAEDEMGVEEEKDAKEDDAKDDEREAKSIDIDVDDLDVYAVENINDVGNGDPLYAKFEYQDWALLNLRFELHLLVHAFRRDLSDPDRPVFHESHATFYFNKYYRKPLNTKYFGCCDVTELANLIKDTIDVNVDNQTLESTLADDSPLDNFMRLTEDARRQRQTRIDAGDETAELKIQKPVAPAQYSGGSRGGASGASGRQFGGYRGNKGGGKGSFGGKGTAPARMSSVPGSSRPSFSGAPKGGFGSPMAGAGRPVYGEKRPYSPMGPSSYPPNKRPTYMPPAGGVRGGYKGGAKGGAKGGYGGGVKGYGR